jgi:hypothetical protein
MITEKQKSSVNHRLLGAALSVCMIFIVGCNKDSGGGSSGSGGELTIMSNQHDPQIFNYRTGDGYRFIAYGERDAEGVPVGIDYIYLMDFRGDTLCCVSHDADGHLSQITAGQNIVDLDWESNTFANVKITSPDGVIYTSLNKNRTKTLASAVKTSPVPGKKENAVGILLLQDLPTPTAPPPAASSAVRSGDENTVRVEVLMGYPYKFVWITSNCSDQIFVNVSYDGKLSETIKLKPGDMEGYYTAEFPFSPGGITADLTSMKDYILDFFKKSKDEYLNEIDLLVDQLAELEITFAQSPLENFKKISNIQSLLAEKEAEYKDRFAEKVYNVEFFMYAIIDGRIYYTEEGRHSHSSSEPASVEYHDHIDISAGGEMKILRVYSVPEHPKAAPTGTYRVYTDVVNVTKGTHMEVHVSGIDDIYWYFDYDENEIFNIIRASDVPVAKEAGATHEITVTFDNRNFSNPKKIEKRIKVIFQ